MYWGKSFFVTIVSICQSAHQVMLTCLQNRTCVLMLTQLSLCEILYIFRNLFTQFFSSKSPAGTTLLKKFLYIIEVRLSNLFNINRGYFDGVKYMCSMLWGACRTLVHTQRSVWAGSIPVLVSEVCGAALASMKIFVHIRTPICLWRCTK